ncbi:hypothetical protein AOLI_G00329590 [Acnodon oligacanthus]
MRRHYRPSSGSDRRTNPGAWGAAPPSAELSARCREVTEQPVRMLSARVSVDGDAGVRFLSLRAPACQEADLLSAGLLVDPQSKVLICEFDDAVGAASGPSGRRRTGSTREGRAHGPEELRGVKGRRGGGDAAPPARRSLGRSGSPAARRTVRSPIPKGPSAIVGVTSTTDRSANEGLTDQPFASWCSQRSVRATAATFSSAEPQFKTVGEREGPRDPHAALCSGRQNREIERQTPDLQRKRSRLLRSSVFGEFSSPQIPSLGGVVLVSLFQRRRRLEPVHRQGSARGPRKLSRLGFGRKSS